MTALTPASSSLCVPSLEIPGAMESLLHRAMAVVAAVAPAAVLLSLSVAGRSLLWWWLPAVVAVEPRGLAGLLSLTLALMARLLVLLLLMLELAAGRLVMLTLLLPQAPPHRQWEAATAVAVAAAPTKTAVTAMMVRGATAESFVAVATPWSAHPSPCGASAPLVRRRRLRPRLRRLHHPLRLPRFVQRQDPVSACQTTAQ
jgi:hypothetical protein